MIKENVVVEEHVTIRSIGGKGRWINLTCIIGQHLGVRQGSFLPERGTLGLLFDSPMLSLSSLLSVFENERLFSRSGGEGADWGKEPGLGAGTCGTGEPTKVSAASVLWIWA